MTKQISSHAATAKAIRTEFKKMGIKAKVRSECFAGGNAVNITVYDQSPANMEKINSVVGKYQYGHFDGMTDMYEYSNHNPDIPQVKYVSVNNEMSDETQQAGWDYVRINYAGNENLPENFSDAQSKINDNGEYVAQIVYRFLVDPFNESTADFWNERKAKVEFTKAPNRAVINNSNEFTVREGSRAGYVEILFDGKPDTATRQELKDNFFRWSPRNKVWWGKAENLPETYC